MSVAAKRMLIGCVCLLAGLGLGAYGFKTRATAQRLDAEGVVVPGQVVDGKMTYGRRGSRSYSLTVEYYPQGAQLGNYLTHKFSVSSGTFESAKTQPTVSVRYLPSDPTVVALETDRDYGMFGLIGGPIAALVGVAFVIAAARTDSA